jgi:hypothetical protein
VKKIVIERKSDGGNNRTAIRLVGEGDQASVNLFAWGDGNAFARNEVELVFRDDDGDRPLVPAEPVEERDSMGARLDGGPDPDAAP